MSSKLALVENTVAAQGLAKPRDGLLTLSGYGIRVVVESGHLVVEDGLGATRRRGRFSRATAGFTRLVVLGHSGIVSLDALRWLNDIGAAFVNIDHDGNLIAAFGSRGLDDARLRRAQALAQTNGVGLGIARELIKQKFIGQLGVVERLRDTAAVSGLSTALEQIEKPTNIDELRLLESHAAGAYWEAWRDLDVFFVQRDSDKVPEHWLTFGVRRSLLTQNPRKATNPANAILNYLYSILEAEARIAVLRIGLDPGIGVMHADLRARDSLVCDLMEAVRPKVDSYVLNLLAKRALRRPDFFETREGVCRLMPPLTGDLVGTAENWSSEVGPVTESLAKALIKDTPTLLTESNRSGGRATYRKRLAEARKIPTGTSGAA
jgi:CRISPR-associated endonuclease Cas1